MERAGKAYISRDSIPGVIFYKLIFINIYI